MAKEEMYHIALDDYEHGIIIRSLNDEKTDLMNEGKSTDAVDDLILPVSVLTLLPTLQDSEANVWSLKPMKG